jgi:hypothetical protein
MPVIVGKIAVETLEVMPFVFEKLLTNAFFLFFLFFLFSPDVPNCYLLSFESLGENRVVVVEDVLTER